MQTKIEMILIDFELFDEKLPCPKYRRKETN